MKLEMIKMTRDLSDIYSSYQTLVISVNSQNFYGNHERLIKLFIMYKYEQIIRFDIYPFPYLRFNIHRILRKTHFHLNCIELSIVKCIVEFIF